MSKRVTVALDADTLQLIDDWRSKQRPIPSQNEAINKFIQEGLKILKERTEQK